MRNDTLLGADKPVALGDVKSSTESTLCFVKQANNSAYGCGIAVRSEELANVVAHTLFFDKLASGQQSFLKFSKVGVEYHTRLELSRLGERAILI